MPTLRSSCFPVVFSVGDFNTSTCYNWIGLFIAHQLRMYAKKTTRVFPYLTNCLPDLSTLLLQARSVVLVLEFLNVEECVPKLSVCSNVGHILWLWSRIV